VRQKAGSAAVPAIESGKRSITLRVAESASLANAATCLQADVVIHNSAGVMDRLGWAAKALRRKSGADLLAHHRALGHEGRLSDRRLSM